MSEEMAVLAWSLVGVGFAGLLWWCIRAWRRRRQRYRTIYDDVAERFQLQQWVASRDLDELLDLLADGSWAVHAFPNREAPAVLAYTYNHGTYTDVAIIRSRDNVSAFRTSSAGNVLAPETIVWQWTGDACMTLGALFTLPKPDQPEAPNDPQPTPPGVGVPQADRMTYRPPQPRWT